MKSEVLTLIETDEENEAKTRRDVFCTRRSTGAAAFYAARAAGMKSELVFVMHGFEYRGEPLVEHDGKRYAVDRVNGPYRGKVELTVVEALGVMA